MKCLILVMIIATKHNHLLNEVIHIRKRYALVDKLVARPFNIFSILRVERNERFTHSAFIAELLNPKGTHCQGDIFLILFLRQFDWPEIQQIDTSKAKINIELYIGDGFIDIWLDLGVVCLCIENKIDAGDQKDQLLRYHRYCVHNNKPYKMIYLTLDGHDSEDAKNEPDLQYLRWSYREHIMIWLDLCVRESARISGLRETIYQYQQLLKRLCGMLQNENEAMELNKLLKKDFEHFEAANNIHEQFKVAKYEFKHDFWNSVWTHLRDRYSNYDVEMWFPINQKHPKITVSSKIVNERYACFCIEYLQGNPYFGILSYDYFKRKPEEKEVIDTYAELNLSKQGFIETGPWFALKNYENLDFSDLNTLSKLFSDNERPKVFDEIINPFKELIDTNGERLLEINLEISQKLSS